MIDRPLPTRVTLAAVLLAGCIALPFGRDADTSLLRLLIEAWHEDWLSGTLLALVLAAPHAFAASLVLASRTGGAWSTVAVKAWVTLMQAELVMFGMIVLHELHKAHELRAPWAIIGFAFVTAARFAARLAGAETRGDQDLSFWARWGAMLVIGMFAWCELQVMGRGEVGMWLHATLAAAFALAAMVPRR
jgi:hypothetical protein